MLSDLFYLGIIGASIAGIALNNVLGTEDSRNKLATSKVGTIKDLKGLTGEGLQISRNVKLNDKSSFEHICILGPTGSGKTTSEFLPNLLSENIPQNSSIVVSDPKGELYQLTSEYQRLIGREPILFSPLEPAISLKYNPLEQCIDFTEVRELGANLLMNGALAMEIATGKKSGGTEWLQMAQPLFIAALLYCRKLDKTRNTIPEALKLIINNTDEELDNIFKSAGNEAREQYQIYKTCTQSERTSAGIKITLTSNLQLFTDPKLIQATKRTDFTADELRKRPICLYISYPVRKANYLSPFTSCFYSQFIDKITENNTGRPVYFLWDEFANVGQLSNFPQNVATVRSSRMSFIICLQSFNQLEQVYGKENALAIWNNLKIKVALPGISDNETLTLLSNLCGETEVDTTTETKSNGKISRSYSKSKKKLFTQDEIRRIGSKELLIIAHNRQPVLDTQNLYFEQECYTKNVLPIKKTF